MHIPPAYLPENNVIALSFATRLILAEHDWDQVVDRSLESLADFALSPRVALFLLDEQEEALVLQGLMAEHRISRPQVSLPAADGPLGEVCRRKIMEVFGLVPASSLPLPQFPTGHAASQCLAAPLVAVDNRVIGVVTMEQPDWGELTPEIAQPLLVLLTVVALGLENARLFRVALKDDLTGLYLRRYFDHRLNEEYHRLRRSPGRLALLMFDVDDFKSYNDTFGHPTGDALLCQVADLVRRLVREKLDAVCRYGGDEFAVIMPEADLEAARAVAQRILDATRAQEFAGPAGPLKVTLSCGVAGSVSPTPLTGPELVTRADQALLAAKHSGRDRVTLAPPD
ncbi:MAG: sensor domain-containing diguanylate cyclase [Deltaproteobacteria bacterium]|nr:sensor domain-containing diguanylate cyclase [Deltaproteobacteria bacterium]